jgi:ribosome production factor 1
LHFRLSSVQLSDQIKVGGVKAGRTTKHKPELILNGFTTRLGLRVSRAFTALFPQVPCSYAIVARVRTLNGSVSIYVAL